MLADVANGLRARYEVEPEDGPFVALAKALAASPGASAPSAAATIISLLELLPGKSRLDIYVSCFCTNGDLLSQWRGYPSSGGGYAVGVRSAALASVAGVLRRAIYDPEDQRRLVHDLLAPIAEAVAARQGTEEGGQHYAGLVMREHLPAVAGSLFECGYCFKHPKFQEEHEWRLVVVGGRMQSTGPQPHVRATPTGLLPYVRLPLKPDREDQRPIAKVIVGPGSQPKLAADAVAQLLHNVGYENARNMVKHSEIPLRA